MRCAYIQPMVTPEEIVALRKHRGWSQAELGAEIGVTQTTVSRLENGSAIEGPVRIILENLIKQFRAEAPNEVVAAK